MPVTGSSLVRSWLMVHDGVMRRSDDELSEMTSSGTSAILILGVRVYEGVCVCEPCVGRGLDLPLLSCRFRSQPELRWW